MIRKSNLKMDQVKNWSKIQFIHKCKYIHNFTCTFDTLVHLISDTFTTDFYLIT